MLWMGHEHCWAARGGEAPSLCLSKPAELCQGPCCPSPLSSGPVRHPSSRHTCGCPSPSRPWMPFPLPQARNRTEQSGGVWTVGKWRAGVHVDIQKGGGGEVSGSSSLLFSQPRMARPVSPDLRMLSREVILLRVKCGIFLFLSIYN